VGGNREERIEKVFCSELAAVFYRDVIRNFYPTTTFFNERLDLYRNVSNIIPEQFGSGAGLSDLLRGVAEPELPLKIIFGENDSEDNIRFCCVMV
jgi:hypothetical protein